MGIREKLEDKLPTPLSPAKKKRQSQLGQINSMSSLQDAHNQVYGPDSGVDANDFGDAFEGMVSSSGRAPSAHHVDIHQSASSASKHPWLKHMLPGVEKLESSAHMGNFVMTRGPDAHKQWEEMPIYVRLGMHLLFYGHAETKLLHYAKVEHLLREQSLKQGRIYDQPKGAYEHIESFVKQYKIDTSILLEPDLHKYETFNQFFYRKLAANARPIASPGDNTVLTSAADCRLVAFHSVKEAHEIWIKGKKFSIANLIGVEGSTTGLEQEGFPEGEATVAVFRLAPDDYHRFHTPVTATLGSRTDFKGELYTVNPQAVNENLNVFTENKRDVLRLTVPDPKAEGEGATFPVIFVAVGALLVGSINWTKGEGDKVTKGDELGYFAYGGSTCIVLFPHGRVEFDPDIIKNSAAKMETVVRVGEKIGTLK